MKKVISLIIIIIAVVILSGCETYHNKTSKPINDNYFKNNKTFHRGQIYNIIDRSLKITYRNIPVELINVYDDRIQFECDKNIFLLQGNWGLDLINPKE